MDLSLVIRSFGAVNESTVIYVNHFSHNGGGVLYGDFSAAAEKLVATEMVLTARLVVPSASRMK